MPVSNYTPEYTTESQYGVTPVVGNYMVYYVHRSILPQDDDVMAIVDDYRYVERPDLLANDIYGTPDLWWVFGVRNGWEDPIYDMKYGTTFSFPRETYLRTIL